MIAFILEALLQLIVEIVGQIIFEFAVTFGLETFKESTDLEGRARPIPAAIGHLLMGMTAGALSLLVFGTRLTRSSLFPGISLFLSPLGTGLAMHWIGEFWRDRGKAPPVLFSFRAGAVFAFGMALVRFVYLEWESF